MKWIKASERLPEKSGWYHLRNTDTTPATIYYYAGDFMPEKFEWLDEESNVSSQEPLWISVKDGLPKINGVSLPVLVWEKNRKTIMIAHRYSDAYRSKKYHWISYDIGGTYRMEPEDVTHWMPLPSMPKIDQNVQECDATKAQSLSEPLAKNNNPHLYQAIVKLDQLRIAYRGQEVRNKKSENTDRELHEIQMLIFKAMDNSERGSE